MQETVDNRSYAFAITKLVEQFRPTASALSEFVTRHCDEAESLIDKIDSIPYAELYSLCERMYEDAKAHETIAESIKSSLGANADLYDQLRDKFAEVEIE